MRNALIYIMLCLAAFACTPAEKKQEASPVTEVENPMPNDSRAGIQNAHGFLAFIDKEAVQFHLDLSFGGKKRADANILTTSNTSFVRMDHADGRTLVGDGSLVLMAPDTIDYPRARFDIYTWSYFFALPFKISDPGTKWEDMGQKDLNGKMYDTGKLSFEAETGDAPDDWYIIYSDPETKLLHAAAYIVTYGKTKEQAEKDPHAIVYTNYKEIDGIPFPMDWTFQSWRADSGLIDTLGHGKISDIKFISKEAVYPENTEGWKEAAK